MMTKKLKPCPFCGGEATIWSGPIEDDYFNTYYDVYCTECNCMTPKFHTEESAIQFWNRREPIDKILEQLEVEVERARPHGLYIAERRNIMQGLLKAIEIVKGGEADETD